MDTVFIAVCCDLLSSLLLWGWWLASGIRGVVTRWACLGYLCGFSKDACMTDQDIDLDLLVGTGQDSGV